MHDFARAAERIRLCGTYLDFLAARQHGRCIYCEQVALMPGASAAEAVPLGTPHRLKTIRHRRATVEHVQRRADGGSDDPRNLVMACSFCNSIRDAAEPFDHKARMMQLVRDGLHPCGPTYRPLSTPALRQAIADAASAEAKAERDAARAEVAAIGLPLAVELALAAASDAAFECGVRLDDAEGYAAAEAADRAAELALRRAILAAITGQNPTAFQIGGLSVELS